VRRKMTQRTVLRIWRSLGGHSRHEEGTLRDGDDGTLPSRSRVRSQPVQRGRSASLLPREATPLDCTDVGILAFTAAPAAPNRNPCGQSVLLRRRWTRWCCARCLGHRNRRRFGLHSRSPAHELKRGTTDSSLRRELFRASLRP